MAIDRPLFLLLLVPIVLSFYYRLKRKKGNYIAYPLSGYLKKKMPKPKKLRHLPVYLMLFSVLCFIVNLSGPYRGHEQVKDVNQAREISLVLDYSGSMGGDPIKASIEATRELMRKRPEDFFNVTVFGSQAKSKPRLRGEESDFLTIEEIDKVEAKMSEKLGGSTGIGIGLFNAFYVICSINKAFDQNAEENEKQLAQLANLLIAKQNEIALQFVSERIKERFKNQALILISDFEFPANPAINPETMIKLIMKLGVKVFLIKVGLYTIDEFSKLSSLAGSDRGKSYTIGSYNLQSIQEEIRGVFDEIDRINPAPTMEKIELQKRYRGFYFKLAGLILFILSVFLLVFKKFREVP